MSENELIAAALILTPLTVLAAALFFVARDVRKTKRRQKPERGRKTGRRDSLIRKMRQKRLSPEDLVKIALEQIKKERRR